MCRTRRVALVAVALFSRLVHSLPLEPIYRALARAVIGLVRSSLQVDHGGSAFGNSLKFDAGHNCGRIFGSFQTYIHTAVHSSSALHVRLCIMLKLYRRIRGVHGVHVAISMDCAML
jgi:hypothetical protein